MNRKVNLQRERQVGCIEYSFKIKGSDLNMDRLDNWLYEVYVFSKGYSNQLDNKWKLGK